MDAKPVDFGHLNLIDLPSDILVEIFSFLPWSLNFARVSRVCKRFHHIGKTRWRAEFLELDASSLLVQQVWLPILQRSAAHLKHLSIVYNYPVPSPPQISHLLLNACELMLPQLEILELSYTLSQHAAVDAPVFAKRAPKLRLLIAYLPWLEDRPHAEQVATEGGGSITVCHLNPHNCSTTHSIQIMELFKKHKLSLNRPFPSGDNLLGIIFGEVCTLEKVQYAISNGFDLLQPFQPHLLPTENLFHKIISCAHSTEVILCALDHLERSNRHLEESYNDATTWKKWKEVSPSLIIAVELVSYIGACKWFPDMQANVQILHRLVALGARTHLWGMNGDTLLHTLAYSSVFRDVDFVRELFRLGAHLNPRRTDPEGYARCCSGMAYLLQPPLHHIIAVVRDPVLHLFLEHCTVEDVSERNGLGETPIQVALLHSPFLIPHLAQKGAPLTMNEKGETVVDQWLLHGPYGTWSPFPSNDVQNLVKFFHEKNVGCTLVERGMAHHVFASHTGRETRGFHAPLFFLYSLIAVKGNADWVNERDVKGKTLLEYACEKLYPQCVMLLLKIGAEFQSKMQSCIELAKARAKNQRPSAARAAQAIEQILLRLAAAKKEKAEYDAQVAAGKKPDKELQRFCLFCLKKFGHCDSVAIALHVKKRHVRALKILLMKPEEGFSVGLSHPPARLFLKALLVLTM